MSGVDGAGVNKQAAGPAGASRGASATAAPWAGLTCLVVIPTYNESACIAELIDAILAQPARIEVLVIDDRSPDGTAALVRELAARDARIHLLERAGKLGLGSAYVEGFRYALERTKADLVFQMDADFSHDPAAIPAFLEAIRDEDLVLGSRYLRGVTVVNWPLKRLFLSYYANVYTRVLTRLPFKDATGGFKCFRREVLATLDWSRIHSDGYSFQIETTYQAWRRGFRIREIPIVFVDRRVGVSKMNRRIVCEAIFVVWRLGLPNLLRGLPAPRPPRPLWGPGAGGTG
ncbi:MAG: polyprenol monophosphomannose synthase [Candidatus Eisenbacteria bacterium]